MEPTDSLLLTRKDVTQLLSMDECIIGVENAFRLHAEGLAQPPKVLGIHSENGGFHIKAGMLGSERKYFAAKVNANFPDNKMMYGLQTIQGIIVLCDAGNGRLLALMDSIEITIIRTGAATAVAAKYLAAEYAKIATICGCGNQGRISIEALMKVRQLEKIYAFDLDQLQSEKFAKHFSNQIEVVPITGNDLHKALQKSQICVTCTPSKKSFIRSEDITPGTFIAAVGADSEEKQELFSDLIASNKIVVDLVDQSVAIGELHHVIQKGLMTAGDIYAELGDIIAGKKPGRESGDEIIIFDSTGTALQDVAAAIIVYEKSMAGGIGAKLNFSQQESIHESRHL